MSKSHLRAKVRRSIPLGLLGLLGLLGAFTAGCGGGAPDDGATKEAAGATSSALIADRKVCWSPLQVRTGPANGPIGMTYRGRTFHVERYSPSGDWAEGYALSCDGYYASGWVQVAGLASASTGQCHDGTDPTFIGCF